MAVIPLSASGSEWHDSYSYLWENEFYEPLLDEVKSNGDEEVVESLYSSYISSDITDEARSLINYHIVRYYVDRGNEEMAERHYDEQKAYFESADFSTEAAHDTAEFDLLSSEYYIWRNALGPGLESSNLGKKIYKADPYEYRNALNEAFRLLSSPHIAGGSPKRGLALFEDVLANSDGISKMDRYSLYSGLAMSSYERKKYDDSSKYFELALEIWPADPTMQEYIEKLEKK